MRRSFGGGGSRGMGGGSGGPGGMLRTVHRAVRTGGVGGGAAQEPFSHATSNSTNTFRTSKAYRDNKANTAAPNSNTITLSSSISSSTPSPFASSNVPIYAASTAAPPPHSSSLDDESGWEHIDGSEDERVHLSSTHFDDFVFGSVPSRDEVQHAVGALQHVLEPPSFPFIKDKLAFNSDNQGEEPVWGASDLDWIEPKEHLDNSVMWKTCGVDRVYDAFHLLQTDPSVQRMVLSLSSDGAIWNAVMNNEAVQEFRESLNQDALNKSSCQSSGEDCKNSNAEKDLVGWIVVNIKAKANQLIEKIMTVINEFFQSPKKTAQGTFSPSEEKLRTSFLLSVVVLLIVVVTRAREA